MCVATTGRTKSSGHHEDLGAGGGSLGGGPGFGNTGGSGGPGGGSLGGGPGFGNTGESVGAFASAGATALSRAGTVPDLGADGAGGGAFDVGITTGPNSSTSIRCCRARFSASASLTRLCSVWLRVAAVFCLFATLPPRSPRRFLCGSGCGPVEDADGSCHCFVSSSSSSHCQLASCRRCPAMSTRNVAAYSQGLLVSP